MPDLSSGAPTAPSYPDTPTIDAFGGLDAAPAIPDHTVSDFGGLTAYTVATGPTIDQLTLGTAPTIGSFTVGAAPTPSLFTVGDAPAVEAGPSISVPTVGTLSPTTAPGITAYAGVDDPPVVPAAYTVPSATTALISDSVIDDMFDRTSARLARVSVGAERDAQYSASAMGIGMISSSLALRLAEAQQGTQDRTSEAALEQTIQEGVWKREDVKTLHGLHIQNWPLNPQLAMESWRAKETLDLDAFRAGTLLLDQWKITAGFEVEVWKTQKTLEVDVYKAEGQVETSIYSTEEGLKQDRYRNQGTLQLDADKTKQTLDVDVFKAKEGLDLDAEKSQKTLEVSVYGTESGAETEAYKTQYGLTTEVYKAEEGLKVDVHNKAQGDAIQAYNVEESTKVDGFRSIWGTKVDGYRAQELKVSAYRAEQEIPVTAYRDITNALNGKYSTEVEAWTKQLGAENDRYRALVANFETEIRSEAERRGWSEMEIKDILEQADKEVLYGIQKINATYQAVTDAAEKVAQLYVALTSNLYSAANYNLSGEGSQSNVSETV